MERVVGEEGQGSLFVSERKRVNMDISDVRETWKVLCPRSAITPVHPSLVGS